MMGRTLGIQIENAGPPFYGACRSSRLLDEPRVTGRCPLPRAGRCVVCAGWRGPSPATAPLSWGPRPSAGAQVEQLLPPLFTSKYWSLPLPRICGDPPRPAGLSLPRCLGFPGWIRRVWETCLERLPLPFLCPFSAVPIWSGGTRWQTESRRFLVISKWRVSFHEYPQGGAGNLTPPPHPTTGWPAGF